MLAPSRRPLVRPTTSRASRLSLLLLLVLIPAAIAAAEEGAVTGAMMNLVVQLGTLIIGAFLGGKIAHRLGLPEVLGELASGIILSHRLLGGLPIPFFPAGIFPPGAGGFAVTNELYGFATLASIVLLFMSGLETDTSLFKKYAAAGGLVGLGGVIFSFGLGAGAGMLAFGWGFLEPRTLFLGILGTATSVGITARILSEQRRMDSPEGVVILAAAVIDDVLGIVLLAVVLGLAAAGAAGGGAPDWGLIGGIALKAFGIWASFTLLGLLFSRRIARLLKTFRTPEAIAVLALGLSLLLAGFFQAEGLAMIIGAYVMGLSLSGTDLKLVIREKLQPLYMFLVPVFFAVMGMLVDLSALGDPRILLFGLIYTLVGFGSKILGCALPALAFGFNTLGALRIGVGMVPRGEVALIIAGIGISEGFLDPGLFGVAILMTLLTTVIPPPFFRRLLRSPRRGTRAEGAEEASVETRIEIGDAMLSDLIVESMAATLRQERFFVRLADPESSIYVAAREDARISIMPEGTDLVLSSRPADALLARAVAHETMLHLTDSFRRATDRLQPDTLKHGILAEPEAVEAPNAIVDAGAILAPRNVILHLQARDREGAIRELLHRLVDNEYVSDFDQALEDVLNRERLGATGIERGIAFPHGRSVVVAEPVAALGLVPEGVDFGAEDGKPARVVVLLVSPRHADAPHLSFLAAVAGVLSLEENVEALLAARTEAEAVAVFERRRRRRGQAAREGGEKAP